MSLEVFGTGGDDEIDIDDLYRRGWESDEQCEKFWKTGEPETIYTCAEAVEIYLDWLRSED